MSDTEVVYVDSVYVKTTGPESYDYFVAVGADFYPGSGISLGKISKLCIQSGSDIVAVVAKVISDKKEFLVSSIFFRNNVVCFETTAKYNGELEPYEDEGNE